MIVLLIFYALAIIGLFIGGIITIIVKSSRNEPVKLGVQMLIASVILVIVGFGACVALLSNG
ncbi:hypothetical protein [Pedobacter rhizosphaerae]|uniref:Uncharacterized protein n=1 Tax=Pedobacter rhizosphaerae TaxID=390241 RepID=A0A1H9QAB1_9SPHI|nr:hypothetical protein [Pedobacter rhizosphaerae]SER57348.1 hypothetical protein SAMN04488023_111100 [Pedobacter rhizosphaerae]